MKKKTCMSFPVIILVTVITITALLIVDKMNLYTRRGNQAQAATSEAVNIFLPLLVNRFPLNTVFGIETSPVANGFTSIVAAKASWVRYNGLLWSLVEDVKGARNWNAVVELDDSIKRAGQNGIEVVLIVRSTPSWAQSIAGATCSPILNENIIDFGQFMYDAVQRYSKPPFNVKYWEIWNEPDTGYSEDLANQPFGCWGDSSDPYFNGEYYADVLKVVYPKMKSANPDIQVLVGGLLLDCDPGPDPNICANLGKPDSPPKYLEGILLNGGGDYFDGISFHGYDYFQGAMGLYSNANWGSASNSTGPVSIKKAEFLRDVLDHYNITGKYLMNTEAAVICDGCESYDESPYEQTKAYFVVHSYATALADGLKSNIWYSLYGWRNSGLLYTDSTPRPAYYALQFARQELQDASYEREITDFPNIKAYEFLRYDRQIWILWSIDGATHQISLAGTPHAVYDLMGNSLPPSNLIEVNMAPIYLEWYP